MFQYIPLLHTANTINQHVTFRLVVSTGNIAHHRVSFLRISRPMSSGNLHKPAPGSGRKPTFVVFWFHVTSEKCREIVLIQIFEEG